MKRQIAAMCVAAACSVAVVAAQGSTSKGGMDKMDKMPKGTVKVTGCVAAGSMADHFMLSHAEMSHDAMGKDKMAMDHGKMAGDPMMSYALVGGDLRAHVGHKVEVTGSVQTTMTGAPSASASGAASAPMFKVESVKMVAASCMP